MVRRLAIWDLDFGLGTKKATAVGNGSIAIEVDVSDWESVQNAYAKTLSEFEPCRHPGPFRWHSWK